MEALLGLAGLGAFCWWVAVPWLAMRRAREAEQTANEARTALDRSEQQLARAESELAAARKDLAELQAQQGRAEPDVEARAAESNAALAPVLEALARSAYEAGTAQPEAQRTAAAVIEAIPAEPEAGALSSAAARELRREQRRENLKGRKGEHPAHARHGHESDAHHRKRAPGDEAALEARAEAPDGSAAQPAEAIGAVLQRAAQDDQAGSGPDTAADLLRQRAKEAYEQQAREFKEREAVRARAAEERRERRSKTWNESVKPFLAENVVWFLGGFLIILGSLYFIRLAWGATGAFGRHLLLTAIALAYSAAFVGVGLWFKRKHNLTTPSRAMAYVGLSLLPVALLEVADAFTTSHALWFALWPLAALVSWPIAWLGAGLLARELSKPLAYALTPLLALLGLARAASAVSPELVLALPYAGWLLAHRAATAPLKPAKPPEQAALAFHLSALAYALVFLVGLTRAVALEGPSIPWLAGMGPLAVLVAFSALRVDLEWRARPGGKPALDPWLVLVFCLGSAGVLAGAAVAPLLALSAALFAALCAVALVWLRKPLLLQASLAMAALSWVSLVYFGRWGEGPLGAPLRALARGLGAVLSEPSFDRPQSAAFALLPIALGAGVLGDRFGRRDEPRLSKAAHGFARAALVATCLYSLTVTAAPVTAAPTILGAALLAFWWHQRRPSPVSAWLFAAALSGGVLLAAGWREQAPAALAITALAGLALGLLLPLLPAAREGAEAGRAHRLAAAAVLQASLLFSLGALLAALPLLGGDLSILSPFLALIAAAWAVAALRHGSAAVGFVAWLSLTALVWSLLVRGTDPLGPLSTLDLRALLPALLLVSGALLGRRFARGNRAATGLPLWNKPISPRARSLHALSEGAAALAWPALLAVAIAALSDGTASGPLALVAVAGLSALLARETGAEAGAAIAGAAFSAAGGLLLALLLRNVLLGTAPGALTLGAAAASLAGALLWDAVARLDGRRRRTSQLDEFGRSVSTGLLFLSGCAALVACAGPLGPLFSAVPNASLLYLPGKASALLVAVSVLGSSLAWYALMRRSPAALAGSGPLAVPLIGATATLAVVACRFASVLYVAPALAAFAVLLAAARLLLRGREGAPEPLLAVSGRVVAALALGTSFLPPGWPFPVWPHAASDVLLLAFLGLELAAGSGTLYLHLLFGMGIIAATRIRTALGIPTQGHGMALAAWALLGLAAFLEKKQKERYAQVALLWSLVAAAGAFVRFTVAMPFGPRTDQWTWALFAALAGAPLAVRIAPAFSARLAAWGLPAALLLGALAANPSWFARPDSTWLLACTALGLGGALLALAVEALGVRAAAFVDGPLQAAALRESAAALLAVPVVLAGLAGFALLLRFGGDPGQSSQIALLFALGGAGFAVLGLRRAALSESLEPALERLGLGVLLAAAVVATARLLPVLPQAAVLVLLGCAFLARLLGQVASLRSRAVLLSLGFWALAAVSSHGAPGEWTTAAMVASLALLLPAALLPAPLLRLAPRTWILLGAAACALAFAAGRSPLLASLGVFAPLALLASLAAGLRRFTTDDDRPSLSLAFGAAALTLLAAATTQQGPQAALVLASGGVLCALLVYAAVQGGTGGGSALDLALVGAGLLLWFWRGAPLPEVVGRAAQPAALLLLALLFVGLERVLARGREDLAPSLLRAALVLPLIALAAAWSAGPLAQPAFGAALVYGVVSRVHWGQRFSRHGLLAAVALCNLALFSTWAARGLSDAQLYTIPLGLSLLVAAQLGKEDLTRASAQNLRGLGCLVLYAGTGWQMASSDGLLFPLVLGLLALVTVAAGALLRVRAFLYLGATALVVDVLANLTRYSARSTLVLAVTITATGLGIVGGMAWFSVRRAQALEIYRRFSAALEDWE